MLTKRCPCCGIEKPRHQFYVFAPTGVLSYSCRPCTRERERALHRRKNNTDEIARAILAALESGPMTASELRCRLGDVSRQRISQVISRVLGDRVTMSREVQSMYAAYRTVSLYRLVGDTRPHHSSIETGPTPGTENAWRERRTYWTRQEHDHVRRIVALYPQDGDRNAMWEALADALPARGYGAIQARIYGLTGHVPHAPQYRRWTIHEDVDLVRRAREGETAEMIAAAMRRHVVDVLHRGQGSLRMVVIRDAQIPLLAAKGIAKPKVEKVRAPRKHVVEIETAFHDAEHDEWIESIQRRKRERERMRQVLLGQPEPERLR